MRLLWNLFEKVEKGWNRLIASPYWDISSPAG
jgi:hypothetical protein